MSLARLRLSTSLSPDPDQKYKISPVLLSITVLYARRLGEVPCASDMKYDNTFVSAVAPVRKSDFPQKAGFSEIYKCIPDPSFLLFSNLGFLLTFNFQNGEMVSSIPLPHLCRDATLCLDGQGHPHSRVKLNRLELQS